MKRGSLLDVIYAAVHTHAAIVAFILTVLHASAAVYHGMRFIEREQNEPY